jgi:hypothetical protein
MTARNTDWTLRGKWLLTVVLIATACTGQQESPSGPLSAESVSFARNVSTSPSVASASPSFGNRGETGKLITITGSGFVAGAVIAWERDGVPDPNIVVQSSQFVSATRIDAVISISETADLAFYDISVTNTDRKKGVGTEQFEVTTAISIGSLGGNAEVSATNDLTSGVRAVGWAVQGGSQYAFYWPDANGGIGKLGFGNANAISQDGHTIGGINGGFAVIWTADAGSWNRIGLPVSAQAIGGRVQTIASDQNGAAVIIGGAEQLKAPKGNGTYSRPRLWRYNGTAWQIQNLSLPADLTAVVWGVNAVGQSVGGPGYYWDSDGAFTPLPGTGTIARAISADGTIAVGAGPPQKSGGETVAVYWNRTSDGAGGYGVWTGPYALPGSCARAVGIDSQNRILANRCAASSTRFVSALLLPPYDAASMITLHGTGDRTDGGTAWGISPNGSLIGGRAVSGGADVAIIWTGVFP